VSPQDRDADEPVTVTDKRRIDPATGEKKQKEYATGDISFEVCNSFEVILQRGAPEDFRKHRRIMKVAIMDVKDIEDNWGKKVNPETLAIDTMYQARIMSLVDASGRTRTQTSEGQILKDSALVKHMFEMPSKEFPNGREWAYSNGVVLAPVADLDYFYCGKRALPVGKTPKGLVDEGVCVRWDGLQPLILKAKSPVFLGHETKLLDRGETNLEDVGSATDDETVAA
jgi:hypothetical protein